MKNVPFCIFVGISLISTILHEASPAKILAISFFSSKSHRLTYYPLLEELAGRGHEITYLSPIKKTKEVANMNEIFTIDVETMMDSFDMFGLKESEADMNPFMMVEMFGSLCNQSYDLPQVRALLGQKFDLVFIQPLFNDCLLGLIHKLGAPLVLFFPTAAPSFMVNKLGGHFPPSFVSNLFLGYSDEMTFSQRFVNFGISAFIEGILRFYYEPAMADLYRDKLGDPDLPPVHAILSNASLVLSNGHFSMSKPRPYLPDVVDVGGIHSKPAKPLPKDLEDFVSGNKEGFILFSMGSALKGSLMSEEKRKMFLSAFSKLRQNVLWKWETESMPDLPKNVKLSKWLPQQDLLGHPKIKLFITHCGGGSTEEAVYHGVPLVGLPMFGDQDLNALQAKNNGYLVELKWNSLTEESIHKAILEVLGNPKYHENARKLSSIFRDQPDDPLKRGVFWIEYIIRHKGAPHLRSAGRKLNYFEYHSFDIIATYLLILTTILLLLFTILRFLLRLLCRICGITSKKSEVSVEKLTKKKRN